MRQFQRWWGEQLLALVPLQVRAWAAQPSDAVVIDVRDQGVGLAIRRSGSLLDVVVAAPGTSGTARAVEALSAIGRRPKRVVIVPAPSSVLRKTLRLPLAAEANLRRLLHYEIDRETPFERDEVHWDYVVRGIDPALGRIEVDLIVVPHAALQVGIDFARGAGLVVAGIDVPLGDGRWVTLSADQRGTPEPAAMSRSGLLAGGAALAAMLVVGVLFGRQYFALDEADSRIAALRQRAEMATRLRQDIDRLSSASRFIAAERSKRPGVLELLAATTDAVPENAYLSEFTLRGDRLTLSGYSASAADLVQVLSRTPRFKDPSFAAPVTPAEGGPLESFTITVSTVAGGKS